MRRRLLSLLALVASLPAQADEKPAVTVHTGHFERNDSGLKGERSLLLFADADAFKKVFGTVPPAPGSARKANPVTAETFEKELVAAVVIRGDTITTYTHVSAKADGDTLTVTYKAEAGAPSTATFASPLVVSVPKAKLKKVEFVENGKEVGTAK